MLHACALYCRKAPIGVGHASCLTSQLTKILTFGATLCSFVLQLCVCVCVCVSLICVMGLSDCADGRGCSVRH